MLRSLWVTAVYALFLVGGLVAPFVMALGYIWVDNFTPQNVVYSILTEIPVSQIMAIATIGMYVLRDRKHPPRIGLTMMLMMLMLFWCTYTTFDDPVSPIDARSKWDWASKVILFALFMPALFRSRTQIEAFLHIFVLSLSAQVLPYAAKTLISGGNYGANLGLVSGNSNLAEGSTLATVAAIAAVYSVHLARFQTILPKWRVIRWGYFGMAAACIVAGIGTYERDALVGAGVLGGALWLRSRHKLAWATGVVLLAIAMSGFLFETNSPWVARMMTIRDIHESSMYGRILVWQWTWDFLQTHPFGGGFYAYVTDTISFPPTPAYPDPVIIHGKAFHSIYFELLGEQGWPGLFLFLGLIATSFRNLSRAKSIALKSESMAWMIDLAYGIQVSLVMLLLCGAFISIAFQPVMYYAFAVSVMLREHARRVQLRQLEDAVRRAERDEQRRADLGEEITADPWQELMGAKSAHAI